jgi:ubiquinone biosynthesis protein UbiJ
MVLARDVLFVAQNLRWDVEEDLSRVFGDIIAHRLAGAGAAFLRWQRDSVENLARQATAYWTEEQALIASKQDIEHFGRAVDVLRDDVARFEKRLELLERRG